LRRSGISNDLAAQYVRSGWIQRLGRGVFMHTGDQLQLDPTLVFLESKIASFHFSLMRSVYEYMISLKMGELKVSANSE
jgi:hypothetical protein